MARQTISFVRGTTLSIGISVVDGNGDSYTLQSGEQLRLGVKKSPDDASDVILKVMTSASLQDGLYETTITPSETGNLEPGRYIYDVGLKSGTEYYNVIEPSEFIILPNITSGGS